MEVLPAPERLSVAALFLAVATVFGTVQAAPVWELTGTSNRIVLVGSVHLLRPVDGELPPAVEAALDEADALVLEIASDQLDPLRSAATLAELAVDPQGRPLKELLGPAEWSSALALAAEVGIDLSQFAGFEPWYVAIAATQLRLAQLGFDPAYGVESRLSSRARAGGKPILGLETFESQLHALDSLSIPAQRLFLRTTLEDAAEVALQVDDIVDAWRTGDSSALQRALLDDVRRQPEVYRNLVVDRNRHFAREIARLVDEPRDYLVVLGVLHLVGPDSVIEMLEEAGYQTSTISKSSLPAPQSGQRHDSGTSSHRVPGGIPESGSPLASS